MSDCLVLNKGYIAIHIIDWKKTMSLLFKDSAMALDPDFVPYNFKKWSVKSVGLTGTFKTIGTVDGPIAIPDIIVLTAYNKLPPREVKFNRENIFQRDKYMCQYCGKKFKKNILTRDHIIPKDRGGKDTWSNIVACCWDCNQYKRNRTPEQAGMQLLNDPREPSWFAPMNKIATNPSTRKSWKIFLKGAI